MNKNKSEAKKVFKGAPLSETIIHEQESDFSNCLLENIVYQTSKRGFTLATNKDNKFLFQGSLTSPAIETKFPFDELVISWNAIMPKECAIKIEAQVNLKSSGKKTSWSPWFELATFGNKELDAPNKIKSSKVGKVKEDILKLKDVASKFKYRITLMTTDYTKTPILQLVAVNYTNTRRHVKVKDELIPITKNNKKTSAQPDWVKDLPVPFRSQTVEDKSIAGRICHATSVAMVLEYYGLKIPTKEVCDGVYDSYNDIYGNWTFNVAYMSNLGFRAYVTRLPNFDLIKKEIAENRPVILSIKFGKDELTGAPIRYTRSGHIIVVRGFTENGDPICNDPAARTEQKGHIVYKKEELERAWLSHHAVAIFVSPREKNF